MTATRVGQVRGILAERVEISTALDPFLSLRALASYSGLSVRTLRSLLMTPVHPLPHYRIGGKILIRRGEFDAWAMRYRRAGRPDVAGLVDDVLRDLRP
jgi:lambda repressor-like predicted transcriptional regulator